MMADQVIREPSSSSVVAEDDEKVKEKGECEAIKGIDE
jgi:hypothetical protein